MFLNMGFPELATIMVAALLLLGPQRLPEFARWLGRVIREVRRTTQEVRNAIDLEMEKEELERLKREFSEHINIDPAKELEKAASEWIDDVERDLEQSDVDNEPVTQQSMYPNEVPQDIQQDAFTEHSIHHSDDLLLTEDSPSTDLGSHEPEVEALPVVAPPPEAVSRGRSPLSSAQAIAPEESTAEQSIDDDDAAMQSPMSQPESKLEATSKLEADEELPDPESKR